MTDRPWKSLRERLNERGPRKMERVTDPVVPTPSPPISVYHPHEIAAMAVGLLILRQVEETAGTRLYERSINDAIHRLTKHASAEQMMRLEVEAHEILAWLVQGEDAPRELEAFHYRDDGTLEYDPNAPVPALVREACALGLDIKIAYFSNKRAEMNSRVISPKAIAAETYVRAYCHARKDERIFRMERIRRAKPVGVPSMHQAEEAAAEAAGTQVNLPVNLSFDFDGMGVVAAPSKKKPKAAAEAETSPKASKRAPADHSTEELRLDFAPSPDFRPVSKAPPEDSELPKEHQPLDGRQLPLLGDESP